MEDASWPGQSKLQTNEIESIDQLFKLVRKTAEENFQNSCADKDAFSGLASLLTEIRTKFKNHLSSNFSNLDAEFAECVPSIAAIVLQEFAGEAFYAALDETVAAISNWRPAAPRPKKFDRYIPVLGDPEEQAAIESRREKERAKQDKIDGRILEREGRNLIKANLKQFMGEFDSCRSQAVLSNFTASNREHDLGEFVIEKRPSGSFLVTFEKETGEIQKVGAERFVKLCRFKRVELESLIPWGDLSARSVSDSPEVVEGQPIKLIPEVFEMSQAERRKLLRALKEGIEDTKLRIQEAKCSADSETRQNELDQYTKKLNQLQRVEPSRAKNSCTAVRRSLERLAADVQPNMPNFAAHIESSWEYCDVSQAFLYSSAHAWEFLGFD